MPTTLQENLSPDAGPDYRLLNSLKVPLSGKATEGTVVPLLSGVARPPSVRIEVQPRGMAREQLGTRTPLQSAAALDSQPPEPTHARRGVSSAKSLTALLAAAAVGYGGLMVLSQLPSAKAPRSQTSTGAPPLQALSSTAARDGETVPGLPAGKPVAAPAAVAPSALTEGPSATVVPQAAPATDVNEPSDAGVAVRSLPVPPVNETAPIESGKEVPQATQAMQVAPDGVLSCQGALAAMQLCELVRR